MIVAVTRMRMMEVSINEVVHVIPVGHAFMSTGRTVTVALLVTVASMIRSASTRIYVANRKRVFIDMAFMDMMQVPIVQIIDVAVVRYSCMSAMRAVRVTVGGMLFTFCFHGTDLRCNQTSFEEAGAGSANP